MQRVNSGLLQNIVPSAQKPPRAPTKTRSPQMDSTVCRDGGFGRDLEKGEKRRWKPRADQAVHLVPVVLLACLFVLYICSSLPVEDHAAGLDQVVRTGLAHRLLLAADSKAENAKNPSGKAQAEVRVMEYDFHHYTLRLRGGGPRR